MKGMWENGKKDKVVLAVSGALALAAVWGLPQMLNLKGNTLAVSNSWFSVFMYGVLWFMCYRALSAVWLGRVCGNTAAKGRGKTGGDGSGKSHGLWAAGAIAGLFSLCIAFGVQLDRAENVDFRDGRMWLAVLIWAVVWAVWIYYGWMWLEQRSGREATQGALSAAGRGGRSVGKGRLSLWLGKWDGLAGWKQACLTAAFLFFCWFVVFLAVYPGFFVYDAQDELAQVQTRQFTTHHPLPHVLLLGGVIQAVHKITGLYNMGIAAYTLLQMAVMAGVFAYALMRLKQSGVCRWLRVVSALYFACFPVNVMFVLCSAKDGIFSGALLLLLVCLTEMALRPEEFFSNRKKMLLFGFSAWVMMSFRHNGLYAFLALAPVMLLFYGKGRRKKMGLLLVAVFAAYGLTSSAFAGAFSAQAGGKQEMLTVPVQQLARVWKYEEESLTQGQKETLYEILPKDALSFYTPKVSDGVKRWFDNEAFASQPGKYIRLWAKVGAQHPFTYLNAWFMTSYGFWYPDTVIDVYRGNGVFTFTYGDSSFFGYEVELPGQRESKIPWLDRWYRAMSLEIAQQKVPVVSMLFSPGFLFWIFAFTGGYAYYRKKYGLLLPFGLLFLVWLTVILGPTYLPRYVLILWFALPGAAAVLVNKD